MLSINVVEIAKSVDGLMTPQSNEGRAFTDFEMLDAKMASAALKKISRVCTSEENSCGREACSKTRQISSRKADCLHDL